MADHQKQKYPKRLNVYVTAEMQRKLTQVRDQRGPRVSVPDVVREALRLYLDDQEQVIGSRRHFQKTLREEIESAQAIITSNQIILMMLVSQWLSPVVNAVTKQQFSGKEMFAKTMHAFERNWPSYYEALQLAQEQTEEPTEGVRSRNGGRG